MTSWHQEGWYVHDRRHQVPHFQEFDFLKFGILTSSNAGSISEENDEMFKLLDVDIIHDWKISCPTEWTSF